MAIADGEARSATAIAARIGDGVESLELMPDLHKRIGAVESRSVRAELNAVAI